MNSISVIVYLDVFKYGPFSFSNGGKICLVNQFCFKGLTTRKKQQLNIGHIQGWETVQNKLIAVH